jgi:hypothetical protein
VHFNNAMLSFTNDVRLSACMPVPLAIGTRRRQVVEAWLQTEDFLIIYSIPRCATIKVNLGIFQAPGMTYSGSIAVFYYLCRLAKCWKSLKK